MAIALNVFQAGEKAIAQEVNDNFSMLQEEITTSIDGIKSDVQSSFTEAKEQILGDIEVVNNSKLNLNLDNVGDEGIERIVSYVMPDYTNEIIITKEETFTVPENGVLNYVPTNNASNSNDVNLTSKGRVQINGKTVYQVTHAQGHDAAHTEFFYGLVGKDSTVFHTIQVGTLYFYPCRGKGAN